MWWIRHTQAGYYANVVGVLCLMWWISQGLNFSRKNFNSVNSFFRTYKFAIVRMESHNNLRFDDPTAPIKVKRKAEASGNPKEKRRLFLDKRESEAKARILEFLDEFLINLSSAGILDTFCSFVTLVAKRRRCIIQSWIQLARGGGGVNELRMDGVCRLVF